MVQPTAPLAFALMVIAILPFATGYLNDVFDAFINIGATIRKRTRPRTDASRLGRIVGGDQVDPTRYPFFSFLRIDKQVGNRFGSGRCGGSLIAPDIVLTAAHCFLGGQVLNTTVYVNHTSRLMTGNEYLRHVTTYRIHPDFDTVHYHNDVAVLVLNAPVTEVIPITLNADSMSPADGENLLILGMGALTDGTSPDYLHVTTVHSLPALDCVASYAEANMTINGTVQLCAAAPGKDSCKGDSGGPLFLNVGSSFLQVGLVSLGIGCALPEFPGVYSRMSGITDFLEAAICDLSQSPPSACGGKSVPSIGPVVSTVSPHLQSPVESSLPSPLAYHVAYPPVLFPVMSSSSFPISATPASIAPFSIVPVSDITSTPASIAPFTIVPVSVITSTSSISPSIHPTEASQVPASVMPSSPSLPIATAPDSSLPTAFPLTPKPTLSSIASPVTPPISPTAVSPDKTITPVVFPDEGPPLVKTLAPSAQITLSPTFALDVSPSLSISSSPLVSIPSILQTTKQSNFDTEGEAQPTTIRSSKKKGNKAAMPMTMHNMVSDKGNVSDKRQKWSKKGMHVSKEKTSQERADENDDDDYFGFGK